MTLPAAGANASVVAIVAVVVVIGVGGSVSRGADVKPDCGAGENGADLNSTLLAVVDTERGGGRRRHIDRGGEGQK